MPAFGVSLSYTLTDVLLNLTAALGVGSNLNRNQQSVANAINGFFNGGGSVPLAFFGLTPAGLSQISGEIATGTQPTTFDAMTQFMGVIYQTRSSPDAVTGQEPVEPRTRSQTKAMA